MNSFQKPEPRKPEGSFICVVGRTICVLDVKAQQNLGFKVCARTMVDLEYWAGVL